MEASPEQSLRAWVAYLRDMGVYDLYRRPGGTALSPEVLAQLQREMSANRSPQPSPAVTPAARAAAAPASRAAVSSPARPTTGAFRGPESHAAGANSSAPLASGLPGRQPPSPVPVAENAPRYFNTEPEGTQQLPPELAAPMPKPNPLESLFPAPAEAVPPAQREAALEQLRAEIGDCTRCPLAYAGRHTIVFGEGSASADLMFIGEGPGADEDQTGRPFIGKAGQLLNNMIAAMGLQREQVYIANIVKCRPPGNRAPEFVEATTCSQFLLRQIDIVRPKVIVALGSTAATYVLGVRQTLASLRGTWFSTRGAKVAVTFHPAFLLRDPRQKAEAWKDLQRVMAELQLQPGTRPS